MARDHAQIRLSIWADDDFRQLSGNAQHLYFLLLTSPSLSYCGVTDWRPARMTGLVGDWSIDTIEDAAAELIDRLYILVDEQTEEVLVRSFVRHDGLMKQPKMATAMSTAHLAVGSVALRGVVVWELQRLQREQPDLHGWGSEKAAALLSLPAVDPSTYPCRKGSVKGSGKGNRTPSGKGSGEGSPTPSSLLPAPAPAPSSSDEEEEGAPRKRGHRIPEDFAPNDELRQWARERGFNDAQIEEMTERFVDHWVSATGPTASKTAWGRAWRNWVGKEDPRRVRGGVSQLRSVNGTDRTGMVQWAEVSPGYWQETHPEGFYMGCKMRWLPIGERPA
jgi:hypothetical protein